MSESKRKEDRVDVWYAFVAAILIFTGVGFLVGNIAAGSIIGVGVGFLSVVILRLKYPTTTKE